MDDSKVELIGNPCGHHGAYIFYKAFKFNRENKCRILTLGEFFFVKIFNEAPVCISELQLLWEDKNNSQLLSSVRLYYLPEDTPEGKQEFHGQDEVLAVSEKIILKLDDLVKLIKDGVSWNKGSIPVKDDQEAGENEKHPVSLAKSFAANNSGLQFKGENNVQNVGYDVSDSTRVTILSYPRYCRYKAVMKRLEKCEDEWLRNALVCAIGGFTVKHKNSRVVFCRETFDYPELDNLEIRCDHLAPNLKGRPRKKRLQSRKESSLDSDSGDSNGDLFLPPTGASAKPSPLTVRTRKDSVKNGSLLPDKTNITDEEEVFLQSLHKYMKSRKTPIERIPSLGFKQIDIYVFYTYAQRLGGYDQITQKRLWKHLYDQLGGNPGSTSAATCTRRHYERLLLPYERYTNGEPDVPNTVSSDSDKSENTDSPCNKSSKIHEMKKSIKNLKERIESSEVKNSRGQSPVVKMEESESNGSICLEDNNNRPALTEQSINKKIETQDSVKIESRLPQYNNIHRLSADNSTKSHDEKKKVRPRILNPVSSKVLPYSVSPYQTPSMKQPYQKSPSLQSPPQLLPAHSHLYSHPANQFSRSLPGTPPPSVGVKPKVDNSSITALSSSLPQSSQPKDQSSNHRPSVIQHTQKIKPAHQNNFVDRVSHLDDRPSPQRQALPAHSNHLKRCYPPYVQQPAGLGQPLHHISPYQYSSAQISQPLHSSLKRQRLQDPSSPHYYLAQMRSLAGDGANKTKTNSDKRAQPPPSHQTVLTPINPLEDQPTDLSVKKTKETSPRDVIDLSKKRTVTPSNRNTVSSPHTLASDIYPHRDSPSHRHVERVSSRSPPHRQLSPAPYKTVRRDSARTPNSHATTPDLSMKAKTFPLDGNSLLHPAFPHTYMPAPPMVPRGMLNISPQLHNMYEAQRRAAAIEEMVKRNLPHHVQGSTSFYSPNKPTSAHSRQHYQH